MDSAEVRAFFESVATNWDEMRSSFYNEGVIDALAEHTEVDASKTIVDVGTGTGFVAAGLALLAAQVVGVDNSPAMLSVARANHHALGLDNVELRQGDLTELPLKDNAADARSGEHGFAPRAGGCSHAG